MLSLCRNLRPRAPCVRLLASARTVPKCHFSSPAQASFQEESDSEEEDEYADRLALSRTRFPTARVIPELKERLDGLVEGDHTFEPSLVLTRHTDTGVGIRDVREDAYWLSLALRENVSTHALVDPSKKSQRRIPKREAPLSGACSLR